MNKSFKFQLLYEPSLRTCITSAKGLGGWGIYAEIVGGSKHLLSKTGMVPYQDLW